MNIYVILLKSLTGFSPYTFNSSTLTPLLLKKLYSSTVFVIWPPIWVPSPILPIIPIMFFLSIFNCPYISDFTILSFPPDVLCISLQYTMRHFILPAKYLSNICVSFFSSSSANRIPRIMCISKSS